MDFKAFRDKGLLWALNAHVFHPRGYAVAFEYNDNDEVTGWLFLGDGTEPWAFDEETNDSGFERFNQFLKGEGNDG